jgi:hypothetical protein
MLGVGAVILSTACGADSGEAEAAPEDPGGALEITVDEHVRECTEACGTYRMRNVLTLSLDAVEPATIDIEWNETWIDGVLQASWSTPIAATSVDLPGGGPVAVELKGPVLQCAPAQADESDARFVLTVDGSHLELEGRSRSLSGPDEC